MAKQENAHEVVNENELEPHSLINYKLDELRKSVKEIKQIVCGNGKTPNVMVRLSLVEKAITGQQWFNRACGLAIIGALIYAFVEHIIK